MVRSKIDVVFELIGFSPCLSAVTYWHLTSMNLSAHAGYHPIG